MEGEELLKEFQKGGLINQDLAAKLKRESYLSGRSVEELIYERRLVDDKKIANLKSRLLKVPYQKINFDALNKKILELIPEETARVYKVAPLSKKDNLFLVGMVSPDDLKAQEALKFIARRNRLNLGVYLISYSDWQDVLRIYSPYKGEIESAVQALNLKPGEGGRRVVRLEEGGGVEEAPIIRIVADTLREAVQAKASDVHIEPQENYLRIRFRINGELEEKAALPVELVQPIVSRVKVISNLKIDETRIPQDGRFRSRIFDREIDFRVSTFPTPLGEKAAIRILDPTTGLRTFDQMGLTGKNLEMVKTNMEKPFGMILITGPTGSGKTTTLYALLQMLNKENVNIVSLEDPVEYFVSGVNQSQVRPEIGYDFASGLRQILRQDPDIIMVGEIRDNETAGLAIHAALTGHIMLSTLHTNNAVGVIPRLIDMKVEPFLLPSALNLMISQRLVSLLCETCKEALEAPGDLQKIIKKALSELPVELSGKYKEPYKIYHAPGCEKCRGRGFVDRIPLYEVFEMTSELGEIIYAEPNAQKILSESKRQGMISLRTDGVLKALDGLISIEEVVRETEEV
ncbi:MAG: type II/IV secretion system protein [Candidatus Liptonbacteria bacterium]|nr:type II/IV secretion system protein [Candidatus Liptonbacteria bacterium]